MMECKQWATLTTCPLHGHQIGSNLAPSHGCRHRRVQLLFLSTSPCSIWHLELRASSIPLPVPLVVWINMFLQFCCRKYFIFIHLVLWIGMFCLVYITSVCDLVHLFLTCLCPGAIFNAFFYFSFLVLSYGEWGKHVKAQDLSVTKSSIICTSSIPLKFH